MQPMLRIPLGFLSPRRSPTPPEWWICRQFSSPSQKEDCRPYGSTFDGRATAGRDRAQAASTMTWMIWHSWLARPRWGRKGCHRWDCRRLGQAKNSRGGGSDATRWTERGVRKIEGADGGWTRGPRGVECVVARQGNRAVPSDVLLVRPIEESPYALLCGICLYQWMDQIQVELVYSLEVTFYSGKFYCRILSFCRIEKHLFRCCSVQSHLLREIFGGCNAH
mmetsp:Transcript_1212/g.3032  ORF Transcript_1212/g.3032 Transcript_1212/m.3032 type:complete len:222 (+) Transcript_1212:747-1412(+)